MIGLSQEDKTLEQAAQIWKGVDSPPRFDIVHDIDRQATHAYDRTSAYLIDKQGIVRQVFPMLIHARPDWEAILSEVRKIEPRGKAKTLPTSAGGGGGR